MNEIIEKEQSNIEKLIYEIRGKQVMIDKDLAKLYQSTNGTKDINKAVKRNLERFPDDFYFQLTKEEYYKNLLAVLKSVMDYFLKDKYMIHIPYF